MIGHIDGHIDGRIDRMETLDTPGPGKPFDAENRDVKPRKPRPRREPAPQPADPTLTTTATPPRSTKATADVVDLDRYVPAFLTWIANKLSRGASYHYLAAFDVGIETWRCLVLLAIEGSISAQNVSRIIGMDKGSVSRCFKGMQAKGLITLRLDADDGRLRIATLTKKGRALHDQIMGIALERERAFLSVLSDGERETLIGLLRRLHENLPAVEVATEAYVAQHFPQAAARRRNRSSEDSDD